MACVLLYFIPKWIRNNTTGNYKRQNYCFWTELYRNLQAVEQPSTAFERDGHTFQKNCMSVLDILLVIRTKPGWTIQLFAIEGASEYYGNVITRQLFFERERLWCDLHLGSSCDGFLKRMATHSAPSRIVQAKSITGWPTPEHLSFEMTNSRLWG